MPGAETHVDVTSPSETEGLSLEDGLLLRALRFGPLCVLIGRFALCKMGCRGLEVTLPGGKVTPLNWGSKAGGRFEIGSVPPEEAEILHRRIFPDDVVLALIDAADWPSEGAALQIRGLDGSRQELFAAPLPLQQQGLLLGLPTGLTLSVARLPGAPSPRLYLDGKKAALAPQAVSDQGQRFEIWEAELPRRIYDGAKYRFELRPAPAEGSDDGSIVKMSWTAREMFQLPRVAPHIAERPRLEAIPPGDVTLALDHMGSGWQRAGKPGRNKRVIAALSQRRSGVAGVALYLFAPTLEDALATPALAELAQAYGPDFAPHIVLPSPEAAAFYTDLQGHDRIEQMAPLITPSQVPGRISALPPGAAVVILPAGASLDPEAPELIDEVRQGKSFGRLARAARRVLLGDRVQLRIAEQSDLAPPPGGSQILPDIQPGRPGDLAAIVSPRSALRLLLQQEGHYGGLRLPRLELSGPQAEPFVTQTLNSRFVTVPTLPICLVVQGVPSPEAAEQGESAARLMRAIAGQRAQGLRILHFCLGSDYKALPKDSPLRRPITGVEPILAASQAELDAIWQIAPLVPECKACVFLPADQLLKVSDALAPGLLAQGLRLAAVATQGAADLTFDIAGLPEEIRGLCTTRRSRLCP